MARKPRQSASRTPPPSDPKTAVPAAALRLAGVQGWRETGLAEIAEEAGVPLGEVRRHFGSKLAILAGFIRMIDAQVLDGTDDSLAEESPRDRLFDVLMRRFDALRPYRDGIAAVARHLRRDPAAAACLARGPVRRSLRWMLAAARIEPWGLLRPLQVKGLGLIYATVLRVWLNDDGEDQAKTMAALDKALNRADRAASWLRRPSLRRRREDGDAEAASGADA